MYYFQSVGFLCFFLFLLPFGLRSYLLYWKLKWGFPLFSRTRYSSEFLGRMKSSVFYVYVVFELFLALSILASGLTVIFSALAVWVLIGPYFFGTVISDVRMDLPMTTGVFLFLVFTGFLPWFLFHYVGVPCIRDVHQLCKEIRDAFLLVSERIGSLRDSDQDAFSRKPFFRK